MVSVSPYLLQFCHKPLPKRPRKKPSSFVVKQTEKLVSMPILTKMRHKIKILLPIGKKFVKSRQNLISREVSELQNFAFLCLKKSFESGGWVLAHILGHIKPNLFPIILDIFLIFGHFHQL